MNQPLKFMDLEKVARRTGRSKGEILDLMRNGCFPKPAPSAWKRVWREDYVERWLQSHPPIPTKA